MKTVVFLSLLLASQVSQATILKYVHCQYGNDQQHLNSLTTDLHGTKLQNVELYANGWDKATALLGSAFSADVPGFATPTDLTVNYSDATQNTIKIHATGYLTRDKVQRWRGDIEIQTPAPRADQYSKDTILSPLLQGKFPADCFRELDNEG